MKFIAIMVCILSLSVQAEEFAVPTHPVQVAQREYMVSGVLRRGTTDISIKLVHSLYSAESEDAAVGLFIKVMAQVHPGYSVLTTLATQVETKRCDIAI